jgi:hypothetical protein
MNIIFRSEVCKEAFNLFSLSVCLFRVEPELSNVMLSHLSNWEKWDSW